MHKIKFHKVSQFSVGLFCADPSNHAGKLHEPFHTSLCGNESGTIPLGSNTQIEFRKNQLHMKIVNKAPTAEDMVNSISAPKSEPISHLQDSRVILTGRCSNKLQRSLK